MATPKIRRPLFTGAPPPPPRGRRKLRRSESEPYDALDAGQHHGSRKGETDAPREGLDRPHDGASGQRRIEGHESREAGRRKEGVGEGPPRDPAQEAES